jgi:hypothetical protein
MTTSLLKPMKTEFCKKTLTFVPYKKKKPKPSSRNMTRSQKILLNLRKSGVHYSEELGYVASGVKLSGKNVETGSYRTVVTKDNVIVAGSIQTSEELSKNGHYITSEGAFGVIEFYRVFNEG